MDNKLEGNKKKLSSKRIAKGIGIISTLILVVLIANGVSKASFQDISNQSDKIEIEYTTLKNQHSTFSQVHNNAEMKYDELPSNHNSFSEELQESYYEKKRRNDEKKEKHKGDTTMKSFSTNGTEKDEGMEEDINQIDSPSTPGVPGHNDVELPHPDEPIPGYNDVELPHPSNPPGYNDDELTHPDCPPPGHIDVELEHPGSPNPGHIDVELEHPGSPGDNW